MPKQMSYKIRAVYFWIFVSIFIVGLPLILFYSAGYTVDDTFGLSIRGGIYVYVPQAGTSVFVGNDLKGVTGFFSREVLAKNLKPDNYLVLVANDQFWPWAKLVDVERGEVSALFPLLVPKVIEAQEILKADSNYKTVSGLFVAATSTASAPVGIIGTSTRILVEGKVKIWQEDNKIYSQWLGSNAAAPKYFCNLTSCLGPRVTFESVVPIRTFDFYPSRDDAIILALDNGVYAVEIDRRQYQNFYPLYRGQEPDFRISGSQIYVRDKNYLATLNLEI